MRSDLLRQLQAVITSLVRFQGAICMAVSHPHDSTDTSVDVGNPDAHLSLERGNMRSEAGKHISERLWHMRSHVGAGHEWALGQCYRW